ncbi:MAG TPA: hypothetical protein DIC42_04600 [Holosporales bacterium]|nr:hypothetical protein [Holosporales bacterium]
MTRIIICLIALSSVFYAEEVHKKPIEEQLKRHTSASVSSVKEMLHGMKAAIQKDDMDTFSKFIAYKWPARWNAKKRVRFIKNKKMFLKNHTKILTKKCREAIVNAKDDLSDLFVNSAGIMIGNGEIWFDPERGGIFAFNS